MAFSLAELQAQFRLQVDDVSEPHLWSDDEIIDFFDEAEDDFCERTDAINDQVSLPFRANAVWVRLPDYITKLRAAMVDDQSVHICNRSPAGFVNPDDYGHSSVPWTWGQETGKQLRAIVTDLRLDYVRLYPIPTVDGTLILDVYRRPIDTLAERTELEVTDRKQQRTILVKACSLAYAKHDAEAYNPQMSQNLEVQSLQACDELARSARRRRRNNQSVGYGGL